ncbi:MAG: molybdenum cofactor biosynthesis protein [Gammaproteobacteria bacterium]|jgi:molybdopterin adenylyltransferase|nr:molybdenum cofactor biosynthesis protein [Gammaproteobacteria bacterium]MBT5644211.1 molybdenum cofactor biosynthesis protein [Gammaproteobacteria bacterium]MBT5863027.1 molybdenum cofactor biosynthesis protein [Gammaproteobacteria bacterium]MBT6734672.1 molybdenum cofactor biosynthesis protein [Gammaproteobacteria bacterium]MBT7236102.1 molybdenum cofactor biosynthesis protein [Gammaproteobacteria bacterium]|tara:strand:- start:380 stop:880 length:501 start_codon:yes stop_codon:yes gene_type:complete
MKKLNIIIIIVSDTRTTTTDKSGKLLKQYITESGHNISNIIIVPDDIYLIRHNISQYLVDDEVDAIITSGGTGITGRDGTPEAVKVLLDKEIEGFGELFRAISYQKIKTSCLQSRALAGVANSKFIFVLPGSVDACSTAWKEIIQYQLNSNTKPCNLVMLMPRLKE